MQARICCCCLQVKIERNDWNANDLSRNTISINRFISFHHQVICKWYHMGMLFSSQYMKNLWIIYNMVFVWRNRLCIKLHLVSWNEIYIWYAVNGIGVRNTFCIPAPYHCTGVGIWYYASNGYIFSCRLWKITKRSENCCVKMLLTKIGCFIKYPFLNRTSLIRL